jgi:hypothetical protein
MTRHRLAGTTLAFVLMLVATGCMLDPGDGDSVGPTNEPIRFYGYHDKPGVPVVVEAYMNRPGSYFQDWDVVGRTTTSTTPLNFDGRQWYAWSVQAPLPYLAWVRGYRGGKATVRSRPNASYQSVDEFYSVVPDWGGCLSLDANWTLTGIINNCLSGNGSKARITTVDYCTGPVEPWWGSSTNGDYQWTFVFHESDTDPRYPEPYITFGEVRRAPGGVDPISVRVEGASCSRWDGNDDFYACPVLGPSGVFRDMETAKDWVENPEPGLGTLGHSLDWSVTFADPFGSGPDSCRQRSFTGKGSFELFSAVDLRDYIENYMPGMDDDPDNDMIPNSLDDCDNSPEDYDGYEDHDGCPEVGPEPIEPTDPMCYFGLQKQVCGIAGDAPPGSVVTGLLRRSDCGGSADTRYKNAKYVTDYTHACSEQTIQVCNGYGGPPGWIKVADNIPSLSCGNQSGVSGWARRMQKP